MLLRARRPNKQTTQAVQLHGTYEAYLFEAGLRWPGAGSCPKRQRLPNPQISGCLHGELIHEIF